MTAIAGLNTALGISSSGLANVALGLSVVSQNVANASTPQYSLEVATQGSLSAAGQDYGVQSGLIIRSDDPTLQSALASQTSESVGASTKSAALSALEPVLGTVGGGTDLGSQLAAVQTAFSALQIDPADATQQAAVVSAAGNLTQGINTLANAYNSARQAAQDGIVSGVVQLNTALAALGKLSREIVSQKSQGLSTAGLENQRAQTQATISGLVNVRFLDHPDGTETVFTAAGAELPTDGLHILSAVSGTTGPQAYYPGGGLSGIDLDGTDITAQMTGGSIGANVDLRDQILPTYQGCLDAFAEGLSTRFSDQGLNLFTDASGNVPLPTGPQPQSGFVGFANTIQINPAVLATPSLVRDGTQAVAGSVSGASAFTPNATGLPGFSTMITRVLDYALGSEAQPGVPQSPIASSGLGPTGTLSAGFVGQTSLAAAANTLVAAQAADSGSASNEATDAAAVQTSLQGKLTAATGVDMDTELGQMVVLQNAYGANAKMMTAIQAMFQDTLNMVTS